MTTPMLILVVEDNLMNSAFITAVLEPEGHVLMVARTGPEGLAAALSNTFDLILLDIELPGLRGDAICMQLRSAGVRTPMVALTASAMPDELALLGTAGFDEVVTKPVEPTQLRALACRYGRQSDRVEPADPVRSRVAGRIVTPIGSIPGDDQGTHVRPRPAERTP